MNISVAQQSLIEQIKNLSDPELLKTLESVIRHSVTNKKYELSEAQKESIAISREQIKNGEYVEQEEFFTNIRKWLKDE